jgi:hypothetical protein
MNLEDYTEEQRAEWSPRQRQWYAVWRNNQNESLAKTLLLSLEAEDEESTGQ